MGDPRYLKSNCTVCDGHIEFPYDALGAEINCPHCGGKTILSELPQPSAPAPATPTAKKAPAGKSFAVLAIVVVLVAGGIAAFLTTSRKGGSDGNTATQTPPQNATPAKSEKSGDTTASAPAEPDATAAKKGKNDTKTGLEVAKFEIQKAGKGSVVYVVGKVVNHDAAQYFKVKVEFNLFRKGMPVGKCSDRLPNLAPNGTWDFKALILEEGVDEARVGTIEGEKE